MSEKIVTVTGTNVYEFPEDGPTPFVDLKIIGAREHHASLTAACVAARLSFFACKVASGEIVGLELKWQGREMTVEYEMKRSERLSR